MQLALQRVAQEAAFYDCVVIVRGGGARLDLAAFDQADLCRTVARMPLPVLSGIGHDVDETVLDLVAHTSLKTPTAVAEFLIQHNLFFENEILRLAEQLRATGDRHLNTGRMELERLESATRWGSRERLRSATQTLDALENAMPGLAARALRHQHRQLDQVESLLFAIHPDHVLRRGYSLTLKNGKVITSAAEVEAGDVLETRLKHGSVQSVVEGLKVES